MNLCISKLTKSQECICTNRLLKRRSKHRFTLPRHGIKRPHKPIPFDPRPSTPNQMTRDVARHIPDCAHPDFIGCDESTTTINKRSPHRDTGLSEHDRFEPIERKTVRREFLWVHQDHAPVSCKPVGKRHRCLGHIGILDEHRFWTEHFQSIAPAYPDPEHSGCIPKPRKCQL